MFFSRGSSPPLPLFLVLFVAVLFCHWTIQLQLDCGKISSALSLTLQVWMRSNWTHQETAWTMDHLIKKYQYNLNRKGRHKGNKQLKGKGARSQNTNIRARYNFPCRTKQLPMSHREKSGTDCGFTSAQCRVIAALCLNEKHLNMCGPTPCPLQLTRSPAHCNASPLYTVTTSYWSAKPPAGTEHTATCWADVRSSPAALCAAAITLHTSTHGHVKKKKKTLVDHVLCSMLSSCFAGWEGQLRERQAEDVWKLLPFPSNPDPNEPSFCQIVLCRVHGPQNHVILPDRHH